MKNKDFLRHGLIGLRTKIIESKNKTLTGFEGIVVDETKNTLTIEKNGTIKKILKNSSVFEFDADSKKFVVDGKNIQKKSTERIKVKK